MKFGLYNVASSNTAPLHCRMSQLVKSPPKYSPFEWQQSNNKNYSSAEVERADAERLQSESKRVTDETDEITRFTQEDVNKKLAQRIRELSFWKDEVGFCRSVSKLRICMN